MATSNNTSWELASTALVNAAYRKVGYLAEGQTLSTTALANGVEALNTIVYYLQTKGMPLWKRTTTTVVPNATTQVYTVADAVKIAQVYLYDATSSQYDLEEKSLYDFNRLPSSASAGVPVAWAAQPTITGHTVSIWPLTSDTGTIAAKTIKIVYQKKFDGFINAGDTLDFPSYWTMAIIFKLAYDLAPESGLPIQDRGLLKAEADDAIISAGGYQDEDGSLFMSPTMT